MRRPSPALLVLALLVVAFLAHLSVHWHWLVDDAVISFSYARNWADGEGLVPWPGGERVEGYSNFLWVALIALGERAGLHAFDLGRMLGALFGAACLPLAWLIARRIPGVGAWTALVAPLLVAGSAQHTIWAGSGLEPPLLSFLLGLGIWRTLVEAEEGGIPMSALAFLGVALTRPEGIAYAAIGGTAALLLERGAGRSGRESWQRIGGWLALFWTPFLLYHGVRYWYFAFEFPAPYYAKLDDKTWRLFSPRAPGWTYFRDFLAYYGHQWVLPIYVIGLTGFDTRKATVWLGLAGVLGVWAAQALGLPLVRLRLLLAIGLVLPLLVATWSPAPRDDGLAARALCWAMGLFSVAFAVLAHGDWMPGHRWMAPTVLPSAVIFTAGVSDVRRAAADHLSRAAAGWAAAAVVTVGVAGLLFVNVQRSLAYTRDSASCCTPWRTRARLLTYRTLRNKLALDEMVVLDADMGAMTWWGPEVATDIYDKLALVDMTFALHRGSSQWRRFVKQYARNERPFHFTFWDDRFQDPVNTDALWFRRAYVRLPTRKLPGLETNWSIYAARHLLMREQWRGEPTRFEDGISLAVSLPAPQSAAGSIVVVDIEMGSRRRAHQDTFDVSGFLHGPAGTFSFRAEPGYGWLPPDQWGEGEVFAGRYQVSLPDDATPGRYDLTVVVRNRRGKAVHPREVPEGVIAVRRDEARVAPGEVRLPGVVEILAPSDFRAQCNADVAAVLSRAAEGDCEGAVEAWHTTRLRRLDARRWTAERRAEVAPEIAACWGARAADGPDLESQVALLARTRAWDRHAPVLRELGADVADQAWQRGQEARAADDPREAFRWYQATLSVDPSRSWARRFAEQARLGQLERKRKPKRR